MTDIFSGLAHHLGKHKSWAAANSSHSTRAMDGGVLSDVSTVVTGFEFPKSGFVLTYPGAQDAITDWLAQGCSL